MPWKSIKETEMVGVRGTSWVGGGWSGRLPGEGGIWGRPWGREGGMRPAERWGRTSQHKHTRWSCWVCPKLQGAETGKRCWFDSKSEPTKPAVKKVRQTAYCRQGGMSRKAGVEWTGERHLQVQGGRHRTSPPAPHPYVPRELLVSFGLWLWAALLGFHLSSLHEGPESHWTSEYFKKHRWEKYSNSFADHWFPKFQVESVHKSQIHIKSSLGIYWEYPKRSRDGEHQNCAPRWKLLNCATDLYEYMAPMSTRGP